MTAWPRIFHRVWLDEPESPRFAAWRDRLAELHPGWEIRTWGDSSELTWLRNQAEFDRYLETDPFGRVPDILRYELLWRFGGVYIDTDFEPLRPLDELLEDPRPFAAWENDRTMCTAILAAPPAHPAIDALIEGLPEQLRATEGRPANHAAGPEWATARWRGRDDVRRLPPWTFYPVGWWEKERLGDPANYHPDTYAVHHWAKGWGDDRPSDIRADVIDTDVTPRVVVLVPYRAVDTHRDAAWQVAREHLERLGWPIVAADVPGEWNRAAAINAAAREAGEWDVAVIADADTVHDPQDLRQAVDDAIRYGAGVVPWATRWKLSATGTERFRRFGPTGFSRSRDLDLSDPTRPRGVKARSRGGTVVVSRAAWDAVGGFDEGFDGWGNEDRAFRVAIATLAPGGLREIRGVIFHLWHPRDGQVSAPNRERWERYAEAEGDPGAMRRVLHEAGRL